MGRYAKQPQQTRRETAISDRTSNRKQDSRHESVFRFPLSLGPFSFDVVFRFFFFHPVFRRLSLPGPICFGYLYRSPTTGPLLRPRLACLIRAPCRCLSSFLLLSFFLLFLSRLLFFLDVVRWTRRVRGPTGRTTALAGCNSVTMPFVANNEWQALRLKPREGVREPRRRSTETRMGFNRPL